MENPSISADAVYEACESPPAAATATAAQKSASTGRLGINRSRCQHNRPLTTIKCTATAGSPALSESDHHNHVSHSHTEAIESLVYPSTLPNRANQCRPLQVHQSAGPAAVTSTSKHASTQTQPPASQPLGHHKLPSAHVAAAPVLPQLPLTQYAQLVAPATLQHPAYAPLHADWAPHIQRLALATDRHLAVKSRGCHCTEGRLAGQFSLWHVRAPHVSLQVTVKQGDQRSP